MQLSITYNIYNTKPGVIPDGTDIDRISDRAFFALSSLSRTAGYEDLFGMIRHDHRKLLLLYMYFNVLCLWDTPTTENVLNYITVEQLTQLLSRMAQITKTCCK